MTLTPAPTKNGPVVYTDVEMIKTLKRLAQGQRTLPRNLFSHRRHEDDPSAALYELRFGSWNAALVLAGLTPVEQDPQLQGATTKWTAEKLIDALQLFLKNTESCSLATYASWRKHPSNSRHTLPPAATIRYRLGSWSRAIALATAPHDAQGKQL